MTPAFLAGGTDNAVHALMDLFDFQLSEKEKPFSCAAETLGVVLDTSDPSMASIFLFLGNYALQMLSCSDERGDWPCLTSGP